MVDGEPRGNAPAGPLIVSPGKHALEVEGPCGKASASVDAAAGALTTVGAGDFAGLKVARLAVVAKQLDGTPVRPAVFLGDWAVPGIAGAQVLIPACKLRLTITAEGLGGFMEDIEFEAGQAYVRDVVLAPGPDMVRIHGGHFRMGPPGPDLYDPKFVGVGPGEDFEGWPWIKTYEVDVQTFEIDRTEVTAEQFHACYKAGYCSRSVLLWGGTKTPKEHAQCSTEIFEDLRDPKSGRAAHPANCVAPWEVEKYCQWVGKRLPSDAEWEFAARSRNSGYACAWGGDHTIKIGCDRSKYGQDAGTKDVCSFPEDNTEQGLCDMMGNVAELVTHAVVPGRPMENDCPYNTVTRGGRWGEGYMLNFEPGGCLGMQQSERYGFRCARDVAAAGGPR
nr:SUMF1/EgtB/PvdO family nonheme iron enzyme [Nannocystis sp.]